MKHTVKSPATEPGGNGRIASGAGGRYPSALCGLIVLYSLRHCSITTVASRSE